jgi:outer membrane immunogenic protein
MRRAIKYSLITGALAITAGGPTVAADLYPAPPYHPPPAAYVPVAAVLYNWTGFYIGGNLGAGWSQGSLSDTAGNTFTQNSNPSFLGGGQVGYNYQFWGGAVAGVEADFDWAGNHNNTSTAAAGVTVTNNNRWLTTLTGRLGYAWDRVLVYGKGGGAWVGSSDPTITNVATGASSPLPPATAILAGHWGQASSGLSGAIGRRGSSMILSG